MPTKDKDGVPMMFLETCKQGDSGFYMEGTEGTVYEQQLRTPAIEWIPTNSIEFYKDEKGISKQRPIRHIKGCDIIYPKEQEAAGFKPSNDRRQDKILMENGFINIRREGSTVGTFDFLLAATFFADNPFRPSTADKIYREIKINERAVNLVDSEELETAAKSKVFALRLTTGEKGVYKYKTDKINAYCAMLNITDVSPETQISSLLYQAKFDPKNFLDIVVKAEQTVVTEISHALQLGLIMFEDNTAQYSKEKKIITALVGKTKLSPNKRIEALADYLQTPEGNNDLTELRIKLEIEKEKQFAQ